MEQESRLDPPLVSTEDDFTPIPITDLLQSWTISVHCQSTYPRPSCQSTNAMSIQIISYHPRQTAPPQPSKTELAPEHDANPTPNQRSIHLDKRSHTLAIHQSITNIPIQSQSITNPLHPLQINRCKSNTNITIQCHSITANPVPIRQSFTNTTLMHGQYN